MVDETSWRIHARGEEGENPRGWLWVCQNAVALPAAQRRRKKLFGGLGVDEHRAPLTRSWSGELPNHFVLVLGCGATSSTSDAPT